jgi:hypothetical protein
VTFAGVGVSPPARIHRSNVRNLKRAFAVSLGGKIANGTIEATPLAEDRLRSSVGGRAAERHTGYRPAASSANTCSPAASKAASRFGDCAHGGIVIEAGWDCLTQYD